MKEIKLFILAACFLPLASSAQSAFNYGALFDFFLYGYSAGISITATSVISPSATFTAYPYGAPAGSLVTWMKNGAFAGLGNTLSLTGLKNGDAIFATLSPPVGFPITSNVIFISIPTAPPTQSFVRFLTQPAQQVACEGGTLTYSVTTTGGFGALRYQWYVNGFPVIGATGTSFTTMPLTFGNRNDQVYVRIFDGFYYYTSNAAIIYVLQRPSVWLSAASSTNVCLGQAVLLNITRNGSSLDFFDITLNTGQTFRSYCCTLPIEYRFYPPLGTTTYKVAKVVSAQGCSTVGSDIFGSVTINVAPPCGGGGAGLSGSSAQATFPNPFQNTLNVQLNADHEAFSAGDELKVYNTLGQEIYRQKLSADNVEIATSDWNKGIYLVHATVAGQQVSLGKVVKE